MNGNEGEKGRSRTEKSSSGKDNILKNAPKTDLITSSRLRSKNMNQQRSEEQRKQS